MNAPIKTATPDAAGEFRVVLIESLFPSPTQPRTHFDDDALNEMAESIKAVGVMQPLIVRKGVAPQPTVRTAASWPFPTVSPFTQPEMLYAERIAAGQAEMPKEGDDGFTPGVEAALKEIEKNKAKPEAFEIIAGERRWRASKLAGLKQVPVLIRQYTDEEVLQAHLIENLQREDLHPLEEAEGYQRLIKTKDENGNFHTADTIAAKIGKKGKSRNYVYGRLTLLKLCPEARDAFYKGELDASTALLIARIPQDKLQLQAIKHVTEKQRYNTGTICEGEKAMSYRAARDYIQREFMLELSKAPFDTKDAKLVEKSGACTDCPKRTGNQPGLFDDVKSKDVCTDTVCFGIKKTAYVLALQKEAEAKGHHVLTGKESKKILPDHSPVDYNLHKAGLVKLDEKIPNDEKGRTWEQALKAKKLMQPTLMTGKPAVPKTIVQNPRDDKMIETINMEVAMKALREAGFEIKPVAAAKQSNANDAFKKQQETQAAERKLHQFARKRLFDTLHQQIDANLNNPKPVMHDGLYRIMAQHFVSDLIENYHDEFFLNMLIKLYMPDLPEEVDEVQAFQEHIPKMTVQQHVLFLLDLTMLNELGAHSSKGNMHSIAKEIGIDADQVEKEALAEAKAEQKVAAKAAAKTAANKSLEAAFKSANSKSGKAVAA